MSWLYLFHFIIIIFFFYFFAHPRNLGRPCIYIFRVLTLKGGRSYFSLTKKEGKCFAAGIEVTKALCHASSNWCDIKNVCTNEQK